ncbi:MAG: cell division protein FtsL [Oscillospiraceae bacterium]|nr:cell division protein FtsL [Oscillospiraceae bacterium]
MAVEAAKTTGYARSGYSRGLDYGTSAPALNPAAIPIPIPQEQAVPAPRPVRKPQQKNKYSISLFAIFGAVTIFVLMIFMLLAHVYHTGMLAETGRLNAQMNELAEDSRRLEVDFMSRINMNEIERRARDELGMSHPDEDQIFVLQSTPQGRAEVIVAENEESGWRGFGAFLSSLLEYFR